MSEKLKPCPLDIEDAFEKWWNITMNDRMKRSKYLAKKAWIAAVIWNRRAGDSDE